LNKFTNVFRLLTNKYLENMKKLLFVFPILFCLTVRAQLIFPDSSATWSISATDMGSCDYNHAYSVVGDTIISSSTYKNIYVANDSLFNYSNSGYYCSVLDSAHKWYFLFKGDTNKYLLV